MTVTASDPHDDVEFPQKGLVAPRYMGTLADQRDMSALGRVQVLRVGNRDRVLMTRLMLFRETSDSFPSSALGAH